MNDEALDLENCIGMAAAAKMIRGRGGRRANVETARRYANPKKGVRRPDGSRLVLRSVRLGGELVTTAEWVAEFERERVRLGMRQAPAAELPRSASKRRAGHRRAVEALRRQGLVAE